MPRQVRHASSEVGEAAEEGAYRAAVLKWGRLNRRRFRWRETKDPYEVLVGEVLLQRTRGVQVAPVFERFIDRWPSATELAQARRTSIASVIRPLGLAKRAPVLKALSQALAAEQNVPLDPAKLAHFPGVGPYTSRAVPVFAAGRNLPLVDWVIARVLRR
jgi:A/G-specific adenine glycosylase